MAEIPIRKLNSSVAALTSAILAPQNFVAISSPECTNCEYSEPSIDDKLEYMLYERENTPKSTCHWLTSLEHETHERWPQCFSAMIQPIRFKSIPSVLVFEINSINTKVSKTLKCEQKGETVVLDVRGLIYYGYFHFKSCIMELMVLYGTMMVWPLGVAVKMRKILTSSLPEIVEVQR